MNGMQRIEARKSSNTGYSVELFFARNEIMLCVTAAEQGESAPGKPGSPCGQRR